MLKQIVSVAIFLFLAFLIGNSLYRRYERPIREGLEGDLDITSLLTDVSGNPVVDESCDIKDANKPIELAAAFERVNKQTDMIRSLTESTEPAVPLKIDKNGDPEYLVITNLKLLMNNGIEKNEASLKAVYDQYIGNREITLLTTELNSIQTNASALGQPSAVIAPTVSEAFTTSTSFKAFNTSTGFEAFTTSTLFDTSSDSVSPSASTTPSTTTAATPSTTTAATPSTTPSTTPPASTMPSVTPPASTMPSVTPPASVSPLDPVAIHAKEIALMCRIKTAIDGHQTLLDRILEKKSDE